MKELIAGTVLALSCVAACGGAKRPPVDAHSTTETTSATADDVGSSVPTTATPPTTARPQEDVATATDQSRFEQRMSAEIRQRLLDDDTLSATAKNVDVTTVGRKVILRGDVLDSREKAVIEAHVREAVGVTEIDDRLDVKK